MPHSAGSNGRSKTREFKFYLITFEPKLLHIEGLGSDGPQRFVELATCSGSPRVRMKCPASSMTPIFEIFDFFQETFRWHKVANILCVVMHWSKNNGSAISIALAGP